MMMMMMMMMIRKKEEAEEEGAEAGRLQTPDCLAKREGVRNM
jgi:hypothetical protein